MAGQQGRGGLAEGGRGTVAQEHGALAGGHAEGAHAIAALRHGAPAGRAEGAHGRTASHGAVKEGKLLESFQKQHKITCNTS